MKEVIFSNFFNSNSLKLADIVFDFLVKSLLLNHFILFDQFFYPMKEVIFSNFFNSNSLKLAGIIFNFLVKSLLLNHFILCAFQIINAVYLCDGKSYL